MIQWQESVSGALKNESSSENALTSCQKKYQFIVEELVNLVRESLNVSQRMLICTLLVVDVHLRDIVQKLDASVSLTSFAWTKELRHGWDYSSEDCVIRQSFSTMRYSYEYLGNAHRLVITPLTDQCYLTLTTALTLGLSGMPNGPAGTGKTETIKDLAKALAVQCIVFNCSSSLQQETIARYLSGMAQQGSWLVLDEFNRITIEVLSVVAQMIQSIQNAVKEEKQVFVFEEKVVKLDRRVGIFATLNPTYAGRTELPDSLKALFRPIAMMVPDISLIAEIMFLSDGN